MGLTSSCTKRIVLAFLLGVVVRSACAESEAESAPRKLDGGFATVYLGTVTVSYPPPTRSVVQLPPATVMGYKPLDALLLVDAVYFSALMIRDGPGGTGAPANPSDTQTDKPASTNNTSVADCGNPSSKHPVILAIGEKFKSEVDFSAASDYGLAHGRT